MGWKSEIEGWEYSLLFQKFWKWREDNLLEQLYYHLQNVSATVKQEITLSSNFQMT